MEIIDSDFNGIINSGKVVFIDFYSTTCGPCKAIAPIIDNLAKEIGNDGRAVIGKYNTSSNRLWSQYGIRHVPTFMIFKNGQPVDKFGLPITRELIIQKINQHI